jgi:hypothetical protein
MYRSSFHQEQDVRNGNMGIHMEHTEENNNGILYDRHVATETSGGRTHYIPFDEAERKLQSIWSTGKKHRRHSCKRRVFKTRRSHRK